MQGLFAHGLFALGAHIQGVFALGARPQALFAPSAFWDALRICLLLAVVARAAWTDLRSGKIGNRLALAAAACGLAANAVCGGLALSAAGLVLPLAAMLPLFAMRAIGAGDVKLLMAAGCIMGLRFSAHLLASSLLAGGVIALALALANRRLASGMANLWRYAKACFALRALLPYGDMPPPAEPAGRAAPAECAAPGTAAPAEEGAAPAAAASAKDNEAAAPKSAPVPRGAAAPNAAPETAPGGSSQGGRTMKFSLAILAGSVASLIMLYIVPGPGIGLH